MVVTRSRASEATDKNNIDSFMKKRKSISKPSGSKVKRAKELSGMPWSNSLEPFTDSSAVPSKEEIKELISDLPAKVIDRLEYRGVEKGQWKSYVAVSDTTPLFCVTQEDRLLANGPLRQK